MNVLKKQKYKTSIESLVSDFENVKEWADFNSFLQNLLTLIKKNDSKEIPHTISVCKRLSQCMQQGIPTGIHKNTLDIFSLIFKKISHNHFKKMMFVYFFPLFSLFPRGTLDIRKHLLSIFEEVSLKFGFKMFEDCLQSFVDCFLSCLDEDTNFFSETCLFLKKIENKVGPVNFYNSVWISLSINKNERISIIKYILSISSNQENIKNLSNINKKIIFSALISSLKDENILVIRGVLDIFLIYFPLKNVFFEEEDLISITETMLEVFLYKDFSLSKRIIQWFSMSKETLENSIELFISGIRRMCSIKKEKDSVFKIMIHLLDTPNFGDPLCENVFLDLISYLFDFVNRSKNIENYFLSEVKEKQTIKKANYFFRLVKLKIVWEQIIKLTQKIDHNNKNSKLLLFSLSKLDLWCDTDNFFEFNALLLAVIQKTKEAICCGWCSSKTKILLDIIQKIIDIKTIIKSNNEIDEERENRLMELLDIEKTSFQDRKKNEILLDKIAECFVESICYGIKEIKKKGPDVFSLLIYPQCTYLFKHVLKEDQNLEIAQPIWKEICLYTSETKRPEDLEIILNLMSFFTSSSFEITKDLSPMIDNLFLFIQENHSIASQLLQKIYLFKNSFDDLILKRLSSTNISKRRLAFFSFGKFLCYLEEMPLFTFVYPLLLFLEGLHSKDHQITEICMGFLLTKTQIHSFFFNSISFLLLNTKTHISSKEVLISNKIKIKIEQYTSQQDIEKITYALQMFSLLSEYTKVSILKTTIKCPILVNLFLTFSPSHETENELNYAELFFTIAMENFFLQKTEVGKKVVFEAKKILMFFLQEKKIFLIKKRTIERLFDGLLDEVLLNPSEQMVFCSLLELVFGFLKKIKQDSIIKIKTACLLATEQREGLDNWMNIFESIAKHRTKENEAEIIKTFHEINQNTIKNMRTEKTASFIVKMIELIRYVENSNTFLPLSISILNREIIDTIKTVIFHLWKKTDKRLSVFISKIEKESKEILFVSLLDLFEEKRDIFYIFFLSFKNNSFLDFLIKRTYDRVLNKENHVNYIFLLFFTTQKNTIQDNFLIQSFKNLQTSFEISYEVIILIISLSSKVSWFKVFFELILDSITTKKIKYSNMKEKDFLFMLKILNKKCSKEIILNKKKQDLWFFVNIIFPSLSIISEKNKRKLFLQNIILNRILPSIKEEDEKIYLQSLEAFYIIIKNEDSPLIWKKEFWNYFIEAPFYSFFSSQDIKLKKKIFEHMHPFQKTLDLFEKMQQNTSKDFINKILRKVSYIIFTAKTDEYSNEFPLIQIKIAESLKKENSFLHSEILLLLRVLFLKFSTSFLEKLEPIIMHFLFTLFLNTENRQKNLFVYLMASKFIYQLIMTNIPSTEIYRCVLAGTKQSNTILSTFCNNIKKPSNIETELFDKKKFLGLKTINSLDQIHSFLFNTHSLFEDSFVCYSNELEEIYSSIEQDLVFSK